MRNVFMFTLALTLLVCPTVTSGALPTEQPGIAAHAITVRIEPSQRLLTATDWITLSAPFQGEFAFTLHKDLLISRMAAESGPVEFECGPYEGEGAGEIGIAENLQTVRAILPEGTAHLQIAYSGEICDPVDPSGALGRVRGDLTSGMISEEGVYLSSETGWYADVPGSVAGYKITADLPEGWYAVSQGDLVARTTNDARWLSSWDCATPFDGCALVANRYIVRTRRIGNVDCSTYFYQDNPELSDSFLDKLEEYLPAYEELFGPLPYSRFDVVENFFTTGYGMAGFTLLGSRVLTMPYATAEGSLAHELVHCWWGNYVFPDWDKGNWCEGVTYFATNYYWSLIDGRPEAADEFRRLDMIKYSIQVSPEEEYPVREFRTKLTEIDGHIGYGKAAGIFIMLHRMMGPERFFEALRLVLERRGGRRATWEDFEVAFEDVSGRDLGGFFSTWLDNKGTPELTIRSAEQSAVDGEYHLALNLAQEGEPFHLILPVAFTTASGESEELVEIGAGDSALEFEFDEPVLSVELDPDYYIFRRLPPGEIPPCLNGTLEADSVLVVVPSGGESDSLQVTDYSGGPPREKTLSVKEHYMELADAIVQSGTNAVVKTDEEVTEDDLGSGAVLCLGGAKYNSVTAQLAEAVGGALALSDGGFFVAGREYSEDQAAVLLTVRNPYDRDYDLTFYFGNSPQAVHKARLIFFYGWDSYVVYMDGSPVDRGRWETSPSALRVDFE